MTNNSVDFSHGQCSLQIAPAETEEKVFSFSDPVAGKTDFTSTFAGNLSKGVLKWSADLFQTPERRSILKRFQNLNSIFFKYNRLKKKQAYSELSNAMRQKAARVCNITTFKIK